MSDLPQGKMNAQAEEKHREVKEALVTFLRAMEAAYGDDREKAAIFANMMMGTGIHMLIHMDTNPNHLVEVVVDIIRGALADDGQGHYAMPADLFKSLVQGEGPVS